jgi:hypothetical protein
MKFSFIFSGLLAFSPSGKSFTILTPSSSQISMLFAIFILIAICLFTGFFSSFSNSTSKFLQSLSPIFRLTGLFG